MTKQPYHNETSQADRLATHRNDERLRPGGTYHEIAASEADVARGRFTAHERSRVTGSSGPAYPQLHETSPWHHDPLPAEPPLGFSVEDQAPVGEAFEVERSLGEIRDGVGPPLTPSLPSSPGGEAIGSGVGLPSDTVELPSPPSKQRKRG